MGEKTTGKDHGDLGVVRWVKSQCHSFSREVVEDPICKKGQNPVSPRADCPRNREEELTGGVWASQEWEVLLTEPMSVKEQNRKSEEKMKRRSMEPCGPWELRERLTLKHTSRWSSADRWSWTAELKWWPSRRKSSSGSYIPVKGAVGNTGTLNASITQTLVLLCLSPVMPATHSHCWAAAVQTPSIASIAPHSSHQTLHKLWHLDLVFLTFMYLWCHSFQFSQ